MGSVAAGLAGGGNHDCSHHLPRRLCLCLHRGQARPQDDQGDPRADRRRGREVLDHSPQRHCGHLHDEQVLQSSGGPKARIPVDSIASGLAMSFEVIKKALENNKGRQLPNLMKIKTAFDLGRKTKEEELCESVFPCGKEINLPTEDEIIARVAVPECSELNMVCPGLSIGCSLCGGHIPALCGPMCPLAGLFCGSSGYFCQFQN